MAEKRKKKYVEPKADVLVFAKEDIITISGEGTLYWGHDDNTEEF